MVHSNCAELILSPWQRRLGGLEAGQEMKKMANDILGEAVLHFDELNKLQVLDPEVSLQTVEPKDECNINDKVREVKKTVGNLIKHADKLAKASKNEKIKAIGAPNLLKSLQSKGGSAGAAPALIAEKTTQLERYRVENETLCKIEADQNKFMGQFIFQQ